MVIMAQRRAEDAGDGTEDIRGRKVGMVETTAVDGRDGMEYRNCGGNSAGDSCE